MGRVGTVCKYVTIIIVGLYDLLALFCIVAFNSRVDVTILETLLATTPNEIQEFIEVFFPWWLVGLFVLLIIAIIVGHRACQNRYKWRMGSRQTTIHLYVLSYLVIVMAICHNRIVRHVRGLNTWIIPFENLAIDLKDHEPDHVALKETRTSHPQKVVIIVGESHSKGHSSLYGYEKKTNPRLETLVKDSLAYVFQGAEAPGTATTFCFKYILNTKRIFDIDEDWFTFPSITTIMRSAGYRSSWFSNQDEVGLYDNMASCYAHICDSYTFNTNKERLDGDLIDMHKPAKGKELVIYHLMGQHVDFSKRYPKEFAVFKPTDYDKTRYHVRDIAAHYDNACLYNDYVVYSIINKYKDEDAVVFYFPDHGLDVFQSSPDYFGHSRGLNNKSKKIGYQIPFIIYTSKTFKTLHPDVSSMIGRAVDRKFCTADAIYTIMNVAGYGFKDNDDAENYSIIKP